MKKLSDAWGCDAATINAFVGVRGDIAHDARDASYVPLPNLREYLALVDGVTKENDNAIRDHLKPITPGKRQAWKAIASGLIQALGCTIVSVERKDVRE